MRAVLFRLLPLVWLAACATPAPPAGGPADETPPRLLTTEPANQAVQVDAQQVRLVFSEYIDERTLPQALTVTPEVEGTLDYRWKGRRVDIRFPEPLRPNTTYILTLDTQLRDARRVALRAPITLAFSTGPTINRGRLGGRVLAPDDGSAVPALDVYAYALADTTAPDRLPERPAYRTQTDDEGRFQFDYLAPQPYFVLALRDRNRNRQPDPLEPFASPPRSAIRADSGATAVDAPWLIAVADTVPPEIRRLRSRSQQRHELRFDAGVRLDTLRATDWHLADSASGQPVPVRAAYLPANDRSLLVFETDVLPPRPHRLVPPAVADSTGNRLRPDTLTFTPAENADTLGLRFLGFVPAVLPAGPDGFPQLPPGWEPTVRFNQAVAPDSLTSLVLLEDTSGTARPYTARTTDGVTYALHPEPPGGLLRVRIPGAPLGVDTVFTRTFQRLPAKEQGELAGIAVADISGPVLVELIPTSPNSFIARRTQAADSTGRFVFSNLPAGGTYHFRAFLDRNGNARWDGGTLAPYQPAEPVAWSDETLTVRARWEVALADTLAIADFRLRISE